MSESKNIINNIILVWPIRILIIVNALILPVLLALLIYFYLKHEKEINEVLDRAKTIEGIVENNINLGIDFIRKNVENITPEDINKFVNHTLRDPLIYVLVNYYNGANDFVKTIKIDFDDLNDIKFYIKGNKIAEIKNMQDLIITTINTVINESIPEIIESIIKVIKKELNNNDINIKIKETELKTLLEKFSNDPNNTFAFILTQYELFLK